MKENHKYTLIPNTIRGKLFLVFGIIAVSAAISAVIAQRANVLVQEQLSFITEDNLPSLVTAHEISEATTNIQGVAGAMATAENETAVSKRRSLLAGYIETAKTIADKLVQAGVERDTTTRFNDLVVSVDSLATRLASTITMRLKIAEDLRGRVQTLASEHIKFNAAIEPLVASKLKFLGASSELVAKNTEDSVKRLNEISFKGLIPLLSINAQLVKMKEALRSGIAADSEQMVDSAWGDFVSSSSVAVRQIDQLERNESISKIVDIKQLSELFKRLLAYGIGSESLFDNRRAELNGKDGKQFLPKQLNENLEDSFNEFSRLLRLSITLIRGQTVTVGVDLNQQVSNSLAAMNQASVDGYGALLKLEAIGNRAVGLLTIASFAEKQSDLHPLRLELEATSAEFAAVLDRLIVGDDVSRTASLAGQLMDFGQGQSNLLQLRTDELQAIEEVGDLLNSTNVLTQQMGLVAADIVRNARQKTDAAAAAVVSSLEASRMTLFLAIGSPLP